MRLALISLFTAWIIGLFISPLLIPFLRLLKFGQRVRNDGPQGHLKKAGTPTMGGLIFIIAMLISLAIWSSLSREIFIVVGVVLGFGILGFLDDFIKVVLKRPLGLKARAKLIGQILLSLVFVFYAVNYLGRGTEMVIPLTGEKWEMGSLYYFAAVFIIVGTTNAVNLTDGLDGLATGVTFLVYLGYVIICLLAVINPPVSLMNYSDLAVFAAALAGSCLSFLLFNRYPAKIFMGDTGSLALGGGIAALAVLTKTELVLPVIGGVFVIEALSVMLQVLSFRITGRRIFRMSPLHHHFELLGWHETKIVYVFWAISAIAVLFGLILVTL